MNLQAGVNKAGESNFQFAFSDVGNVKERKDLELFMSDDGSYKLVAVFKVPIHRTGGNTGSERDLLGRWLKVFFLEQFQCCLEHCSSSAIATSGTPIG